ncbi:MFS transporter [Clostridium sp. A1-XYC3]|uniref:MFS transporter n=1 Tax=Clostridium tanneri TaxID=3037988 RepID=A0ABU4JQZ3_9CLOT|nr:MFS transporter [Clostridium sp. A1-XYC3]MDW8800576.1 MFS transporter [Clostridium sp. A1-XYC3]
MKINNNKLEFNIIKNYIFIFLSRLDLTQGIWMIYFATKGMDLTKLGILEGIFHLVSFSMEVPTGVIADLWGRRVSRILGRLLAMISMLLLIFSNDFYMFALSFTILAISYNLESGAGDALLYDSLKVLGREEEYVKINGKNEMFMQIGSVAALVLGGYLGSKDYYLAFLVSAIIAGITFIQSFTFVEPADTLKSVRVVKYETVKKTNLLLSQIIDSINIIKGNKKVGFLIILINIVSILATSMFYYLQNFWKTQGNSEFTIGIYLSISSLLAGFMATKVYKLKELLKEKGIMISIPIIIALSIWGIVITSGAQVFYAIICIADSIAYVIISDYINKLIPSKNRATILSFQSMVFSFFMILLFPLIGKLGDCFSLNFSFIIMAIIASLLSVLNVYVLTTKFRSI